jgi:hypothetical protein
MEAAEEEQNIQLISIFSWKWEKIKETEVGLTNKWPKWTKKQGKWSLKWKGDLVLLGFVFFVYKRGPNDT